MEKTEFKLPEVCCARCKHHAAVKLPDGQPATQCRKRPPTVHGGFIPTPQGATFQVFTVFPTVHLHDEWCGEFDRRLDA